MDHSKRRKIGEFKDLLNIFYESEEFLDYRLLFRDETKIDWTNLSDSVS